MCICMLSTAHAAALRHAPAVPCECTCRLSEADDDYYYYRLSEADDAAAARRCLFFIIIIISIHIYIYLINIVCMNWSILTHA